MRHFIKLELQLNKKIFKPYCRNTVRLKNFFRKTGGK